MKENKTKATTASVSKFLDSIDDEKRKSDSKKLLEIMQEVTELKPYMYGSSIVGFGTYHYKYDSGREGDTIIVGFSPRKQALVLYGVIFYDQGTDLAKELGPHTEGKGCLYIKDLDQVDEKVLKQMVQKAFKEKSKNP